MAGVKDFSSNEERDNAIYNKYTEILSSDFAMGNNYTGIVNNPGYIIGQKNIKTIFGIDLNIKIIVFLFNSDKWFTVSIAVYHFSDTRENIYFNLSFDKTKIHNISDIGRHPKVKLFQKILKDREEILSNIYEVYRIFNFSKFFGGKITGNSLEIKTRVSVPSETLLISVPLTESQKYFGRIFVKRLPDWEYEGILTRFDSEDLLKIDSLNSRNDYIELAVYRLSTKDQLKQI